MTAPGLRLRHLVFHGPNRPAAAVEFGAGLNVVLGSSETGKTFIVETIDFMLGGRPPLRDIPDRVGYDRILLGMETIDGEEFTLHRSVEGGAFRAYAGLHRELPGTEVEGKDLADQHNERSSENVSTYLLERCGLAGKRVRKNKLGETNSLSFRHLARLVVVNENEIIRPRSPLLDENPTANTPNVAAFKLLLTGVDDSALTASRPRTPEVQTREAQLGLLDQLFDSYRSRLRDLTSDPGDLEDQLGRIDASLVDHTTQLNATESDYRELTTRRRDLRKRLEDGRERRTEIDSLLARFDLLGRHYLSDLGRLRGIEEGGTLFQAMGQGPCPLCGADPEHHRRHASSDVNIDAIVIAARSEIVKIEVLRQELTETVAGLQREADSFDRRLPIAERDLRRVAEQVERLLAPRLNRLRASYKTFADKRGEVREAISLLQTIRDIERRRTELENGADGGPDASIADGDLPASIADGFAQGIEAMLNAWHFPDSGRVFFDTKTQDLVIAGKRRTARGKGLRAITHAAFTLGILDYCRRNSTPHPGFVILDSPLLAYRPPKEGDTEAEGSDDELRGTDLKDRFYTYLGEWSVDRQVVIVENTDPPDGIRGRSEVTFFSKNPHSGRYGFFPVTPSSGQTASRDEPPANGEDGDDRIEGA
jgi:hypothetical protein